MEGNKPIDLNQYAENVVSFENSVLARAKAVADKEVQAALELAEPKAKNSHRLSEVRLAEARKTRQSKNYKEQKEIHARLASQSKRRCVSSLCNWQGCRSLESVS